MAWANIPARMKRNRQQRRRTRLSIVVMAALLWAQLALAMHPACTLSSMALEADHASASATEASPDCHGQAGAEEPGCESHCGRADLSQETQRLPSVPALGAPPMVPMASLRHLPNAPPGLSDRTPPVSWHRPTPHPAALLLI